MADVTTTVKVFFCPPGIPINITQEMQDGILLLANSSKEENSKTIDLLKKHEFVVYGSYSTENFECKKFDNDNFNPTTADCVTNAMIGVFSKKIVTLENRSGLLCYPGDTHNVDVDRKTNYALMIANIAGNNIGVVFVYPPITTINTYTGRLSPLLNEIEKTQQIAKTTIVVSCGICDCEQTMITNKMGPCILKQDIDKIGTLHIFSNSQNIKGTLKIFGSEASIPFQKMPQDNESSRPAQVESGSDTVSPLNNTSSSSFTFSKIFWGVLGALLLVLTLVGAFVYLRRKPSAKA